MKRLAPKMMAFVIILMVGIFVGIEWTQAGIERVYGPMDADRTGKRIDNRVETVNITNELNDQKRGTADRARPEEIWIDVDRQQVRYVPAEDVTVPQQEHTVEPPLTLGLQPVEDAPVNQLADKAAGMLSQLSEAGMKAVVGLFSGLF
ncbi:hypothetical protein [Paenibacillus marinisediminis]